MKKAIIIIAIVVFGGSAGFSQNIWNISYDIGIPLGDMTDYISKTSFRGFTVNGNAYVTDNLTLGGTVQWSAFYEKYQRDTYEIEDGAVTSTVWARMYIFPLIFNARYHFIPDGTIQPYAGLGLGAYYITEDNQVGLYDDSHDNWGFGLTPEAGLYYPFGLSDVGLNFKVTYNYVFYNENNHNNLSYLSFSIGIAFFSF